MELSEVKKNYAQVKAKIAGAAVTLIAVSKTKPFEMIHALYEEGHRDFGENYAQELVEKAEFAQLLGLKEIRWHFIGHLQSNKIKSLLPWVYAIHTIDSLKRAQNVQKRWEEARSHAGQKLKVFWEINIDGETAKAGMSPEEFKSLTSAQLSQLSDLDFRGLMCIPSPDHSDASEPFKNLRALSECRAAAIGPELSMGMSGDFELAISCGATHVRVGSLIFGTRA